MVAIMNKGSFYVPVSMDTSVILWDADLTQHCFYEGTVGFQVWFVDIYED